MTGTQIKAAKAVVGLVWLILLALILMGPSGLRTPAQTLFWLLLAVHAIECAIYWRTLRATGSPMAIEIVQTLLFGYIRYQEVRRYAAPR